jgi:hypothetical protein
MNLNRNNIACLHDRRLRIRARLVGVVLVVSYITMSPITRAFMNSGSGEEEKEEKKENGSKTPWR